MCLTRVKIKGVTPDNHDYFIDGSTLQRIKIKGNWQIEEGLRAREMGMQRMRG